MMPDKVSTLLLFGATGDLSRRMLLPSLYALDSDGLLPDELRIIGTARSELDDASFRGRAAEALQEHLPEGFLQEGIAQRFLARLHYVPVDITERSDFERLQRAIGDPCRGVAIFLSTAPSLFKPTIDGLEAAGLACPTVRMALEKPLGTSLESSREINDAVASAFALPGTWSDIDVSNVEITPETGEVAFPINALGLPYNEVEISYTAGFAEIPDGVKFACAQLVRNAQSTPALNVRAGRLDRMHMEYFSDTLLDETICRLLAPFIAQKVG